MKWNRRQFLLDVIYSTDEVHTVEEKQISLGELLVCLALCTPVLLLLFEKCYKTGYVTYECNRYLTYISVC